MDKQIFIINGSGGTGKDTFIKILEEILYEDIVWSRDQNLVVNFSSVDKVKEIARIIGWNGEKTERNRKFLSELKQLCIDYNDMPFNSIKEKANEFLHSNSIFLFLHIREPKEIEKAKQSFKAKTMLIKRDVIEHIISNESDKNVYDYEYDIVIDNNGTLENLETKAEHFFYDCKNNTIKKEY